MDTNGKKALYEQILSQLRSNRYRHQYRHDLKRSGAVRQQRNKALHMANAAATLVIHDAYKRLNDSQARVDSGTKALVNNFFNDPHPVPSPRS